MEASTRARSCCTTPSAMCYWAAVFLLLYGGSLVLRATWPAVQPYGDTLILAAMGAACLLNFRRNRTLHCAITAPIFLVGAAIAALAESGRWNGDLRAVWGVVLIGVAAAFIIEWRSFSQRGPSNA